MADRRWLWGRGSICLGTWLLISALVSAAEKPTPQPGRLIPVLPESGNLVPNASFECGSDGWGSAELRLLPGWYSPLSRLFGELDSTTAADGHTSLKIELTPENQPIVATDYLVTQSQRIDAPLAANLGWIAVTAGQAYTFSVAMKGAVEGTPARLVVRQFCGMPIEKPVRLSTQWQRYEVEFTAQTAACYVLAGPELRATDEQPQPPERATVWLDAVRLAPKSVKGPFQTRQPLELGVVTDKPGNVFSWDEPLRLQLAVASSDRQQPQKASIALRLIDFFDREIWKDTLAADVPAGSAWRKELVLPPAPQRRGFLRLEATLTSGTVTDAHRLRLAAIPIYTQTDSRFGINHAFGWPEQSLLCRQAGLLWVRDWSPKWQAVEPKKGEFTFAASDAVIDPSVRQNLKVLGLLGFPSSHWSSSAPADVQPPDPWYHTVHQTPDPERQKDTILMEEGLPHVRLGYAPRDLDEYANYVAATVNHYKDRIHDWQAFNEPLDGAYSFPAAQGYTMADYVRHLEVFSKTARKCDPHCRLLGGFVLGDAQGTAKRLEEFITLGGLKQLDVLTYHTYPGQTPPEFIEEVLQAVHAVMDRHGIRKPIWFTEFAYFADDDPWQVPWTHWAPLLASERVQAEYNIRLNTLLLANGVEKVFHHAGVGAGVNHTPLWGIFLRYGDEPFKAYASQAVLAQMLTPSSQFVKRLLPDQAVRAYLFRDTKRTVAVVWAPAGAEPTVLQLKDSRLQPLDLMGRPQTARTFTPTQSPVFVAGEGVTEQEFEKALIAVP